MTATTDTQQRRKANRMTPHIAVTAGRPRITDLARAAGRKLSNRLHTAADDHARVNGWDITETPGPLGLTGRHYRDPRFTARRSSQSPAAGNRRAS